MNDTEIFLEKYAKMRGDRHKLLSEKNDLLREKAALVDEKENLEREVQGLKKALDDKQIQLDLVTNSRGWQALEKLRKIKNLGNRAEVQEEATPVEETAEEAPTKKVAPKKKLIKSYISHYEENEDFSKYKTDIKALAFYLPQFHTFKENDEWWGKGFTEWTNVRGGTPRFRGHYQPREPHEDFGYYMLDDKTAFEKQIKLAKQHGLYGFAFYYYWFSGKQLMKKSMDIWLKNTDLDFPFCLCWANENWVRTWDGRGKDILMEQKYKDEDPVKFIKDLKKYLLDPRYIRVDGKPIIMVYKPEEIPNFSKVVETWREVARTEGIGEILVWSKNNIFDNDYSRTKIVDAEFDFAPNSFNLEDCGISENEQGLVYDYGKIVNKLINFGYYDDHMSIKPFYYSCMMGWDNSCRRKDSAFTVFANYSPELFYEWLRTIIAETRRQNPEDKRFIFIDAWNEWAEGTYLEPDKKYGYTNINTLSRAIFDLPENKSVVLLNSVTTVADFNPGKVALQIHIYYPELVDEIIAAIQRGSLTADFYITTDKDEKKRYIADKFLEAKIPVAEILVVENRGRDILPFLRQMANVYKKYDIVGHMHTKKSIEFDFGEEWRSYLFSQMLGPGEYPRAVLALFQDPKTGIVFPANFEKVQPMLSMGGNFSDVNLLLDKMHLGKYTGGEPVFPAGSMFWARREVLENLFLLNLSSADFVDESGQIDGTLAHAIERLLGVLPGKVGLRPVEFFVCSPKHS